MGIRRKRVIIDKRVGQTPLEAIDEWKLSNPAYADIPASYAGRLDPMAEGTLLVLLGDECKRQKSYHGLDKEYVIEVALDLSTDTGDVLGMPVYAGKETALSNSLLKKVLQEEVGKKLVPYPAYSSKTVNGKPLFQYALEGTLGSIEIPEHEETIYRIQQLSTRTIPVRDIRSYIAGMLALAPRSTEPSKALGADFRQDAIRAAWDDVFDHLPERDFTVMTLKVTAGSGTYMRTLAERIGKEFGTSGMTLSIRRNRIGSYLSIGRIGFWTKLF